jgi:ubiquinone/menaquinone biosynthesis C-methylase UbiE
MMKNQLELWKIKTECERLQKRFGDYDVFMKNQGNKENKIPIFSLVNRLLEQSNNELVLLDVGCGPGHFLWSFKEKVSKLIGLDYSENMLKLAEEQLNKYNVETEFLEGSCWDMPLSDNYVDISLQVDVCMHIGGSWDAIKEMIRVSKKYVVFTGPGFETFDNTMDKRIGKKSFSVSVPLLKKELNILQKNHIIKSYDFLERPRSKTYNHKILFVEKV